MWILGSGKYWKGIFLSTYRYDSLLHKTHFSHSFKSCNDKDSRTFTLGRDRKVELYFGLEDVFVLSGFLLTVDRLSMMI